MREKIQSLQNKLAEQTKLLDVLRMWDEVKAQGIDPETVEAFTLKEEFISKKDQDVRRRNRISIYAKPDPFLTRYNAVKLKDGSYKQLEPSVRRPGVGF